uniref:Endochitinase PR4-like n=1 Tax=Rhizophora mucronata TaxID=61149 RepID=A0A2P2NGI0_RHIMU
MAYELRNRGRLDTLGHNRHCQCHNSHIDCNTSLKHNHSFGRPPCWVWP